MAIPPAPTQGSIPTQGSVISQGDQAMGADAARAAYGVDGTGLTVGILSDSFDLEGARYGGDDMARDIATGDLPVATRIVMEGPASAADGNEDEGRAMAQIVHDVAPGAAILFATAKFPQLMNDPTAYTAAYAHNILALADAGANVIVDDFPYAREPIYQDSAITQAISAVVARGVTYVTSAGNNANRGYEAAFTPGDSRVAPNGKLETFHSFAPGQDDIAITLPVAGPVTFTLQWNQPYASVSPGRGATSDIDVFVRNGSGAFIPVSNIDNVGGDPAVNFTLNPSLPNQTFHIQVGLASGAAPGDFRLIQVGNGRAQFETLTSNLNPAGAHAHEAAADAISVGAASYATTPAYGGSGPFLEGFSSIGPSRVDIDVSGNRLPSPEIRRAPYVVGPDGGDTTFFQAGRDPDGDGFPNFSGTSAAAPHVAALAALMLEANPRLTPLDLRHLLQDSALDMGPTGLDRGTGSGFVQGSAVGYAATGVITNDAHKPLLLGTHLSDTLIGGPGGQTLFGFGGGDIYQGAAAGLAGDTLGDFSQGDTIRVTDAASRVYGLAFADGRLTFSTSADGAHPVSIALAGAAFSGAPQQHADPAGGVAITFSRITAQDDAAAGRGVAQALSGNALANDHDASGGLHVAAVQFAGALPHDVPDAGSVTVAGSHGSLVIAADGGYRYQPTALGGDVFTQILTDAAGDHATATLAFTVAPASIPDALSFGFALTEARFDFSHGRDLMTAPDGTASDLTGVGAIAFTDGAVHERDGAPLVDDLFYAARNPDVWAAHLDPDRHYAEYGWREGRDPNALFSTTGYLAANPDVAAAGIDPLAHYDAYGWHEGRSPGPGFSAEAYLAASPDVAAAGIDPLAHALAFGEAEGRAAFPGLSRGADGRALYGDFDATFYRAHNPDVAEAAARSGVDANSFAFAHYLGYGAAEGRDPNVLFSTTGYLAANPDVAAAGINPLLHYESSGWHEGRDPSAVFHTNAYLAAHPDVAAAGIDPLHDMLTHGAAAGMAFF